MNTNEKIMKLRELMILNNLDAYIVYSSDAHQSEYVASHWKSRTFMSGFTGSAGTVLITRDFAALWADGRYFIQAATEIAGSEFQLMKIAIPGYPTIPEWLSANLKEGARIGIDGRTVTVTGFNELTSVLKALKGEMVTDLDLVGEIWAGRPALPVSTVFVHDQRFAGMSYREKLAEVRAIMSRDKVTKYFMSSMDDIAWLFNLRGSDIPCNPVFHAYSLVGQDSVILFMDKNRETPALVDYLKENNIQVVPYESVTSYLSEIKNERIFMDPDRTSILHKAQLEKSQNELFYGADYTTRPKGIKNSTEIKCLRGTHDRDSLALTRFMYWLKSNVGSIPMDEISIDEKLFQFRKIGENFMERAFNTIAGYRENAAMMHYSATPEKKSEIFPEGFLLVDSGGQYLDGTTDITRTFVLGPISAEEKKDFTIVLKSHIGLARPRFLAGTTGGALDILARTPMWNEGLDYKCGTGHGVGFFLNVHEGPHSFKPIIKAPLELGMVITNEPGIYKEGRHGIRIENTQLVVEDIVTQDGGTFYKFETLSFVPIDLDGIMPELLTPEEKAWLNAYHAECRNRHLANMETPEEKEWLKKYTREV